MSQDGPLASAATTMGKALDGLAARQRVIANNVANMDTPGFRASTVRFEEQLRNAMSKGERDHVQLAVYHPRHLSTNGTNGEVEPQVALVNNATTREDGNNVDIDREMTQLAETTVTYNALVQLITARVSLARYIVNEGRR